MCMGKVEKDSEDPAASLCKVFLKYSGYHSPFTEGEIRTMIRKEWVRICYLAHKIHDEETSEEKKLDRAIEEVACLSVPTLRNVLTGNENQETVDLVKYYARKVLDVK